MRYTKKFLQARFELAMNALRLDTGECYTRQPDGKFKANVGVHFVDYYPIGGGYRISVIANEGGAESHFGGMSERYSASEFKAYLDGIIAAARSAQRTLDTAKVHTTAKPDLLAALKWALDKLPDDGSPNYAAAQETVWRAEGRI